MLYICDQEITNNLKLERYTIDKLNQDILDNYYLQPSFVILKRNSVYIRKRISTENFDFVEKYIKYLAFVDVMPTKDSGAYENVSNEIKKLITDRKIDHRIRMSPEFLKTTVLSSTCEILGSLLPNSSFWVNISRFRYPGYRWHTDQVNLESDSEQNDLVEDATINICLGEYINSYAELETNDGIHSSTNHRDNIIFFDPKKLTHRIVVEKNYRDVMEFRSFNVNVTDIYEKFSLLGTINGAPKVRDER